jgi:hypothetical protein
MFREVIKKSPLDKSHFGAGSIVRAGEKKYLVITINDKVTLLSLDTFEFFGNGIESTDVNYLSEDEARQLINQTVGAELKLEHTDDFELLPAGLKAVVNVKSLKGVI